MSEEISFNGLKYISASDAAEICHLTRDYVARLAREKKVLGRQIGRNWYVNDASLKEFLIGQEYQNLLRRKELVRERKEEYKAQASALAGAASLAQAAVDAQRKVASAAVNGTAQLASRANAMLANSSSHLPYYAVSPGFELLHKVAAAVLGILFFVGIFAVSDALIKNSPSYSPETAGTPSREVAAVGGFASGTFASILETMQRGVYTFVAPLFGGQNASSQSIVAVQISAQPNTPLAAPATRPQKSSASTLAATPKSHVTTQTIVQQPVIQKIYETQPLAVSGEVSENELNTRLQQLDNKLSEQIFSATAANSTVIAQNYNVTAQTNAIDKLDGTTITNASISGGSISNANISGGTISGVTFTGTTTLEALAVTGSATSSYAGGINITGGCVSVNGNCIGTGLASNPGGSDMQVEFNNQGAFAGSPLFTFSTSTATLAVLNASTTNFTAANATSTNATTTNLYVSGAIGLGSALPISSGGTGTSSAPSYGELLVGNGSGGYSLVATSSLGIVGGTGGGGGTSNVSTSSENTWSALQIFAGNASSSNFSNFGTAYFGGTATSSFNNAGQLTLANLTNALLSANGSGQVVATTSIGTNVLTGSLGSINGQTLTAGGSVTISAASSTLLANNNTFSGSDTFSVVPKLASLTGLIGANAGSLYQISTSSLDANITGNAGTVTNGVYTTTFGNLFAGQLAGTTTDALAEGTNNLYFTSARATANFVSNLAGTTSVASITALPNLSLPTTQLSGTVSNTQLANDSITVNGTSFSLGDSKTITAASSTLLADMNTWTGLQSFSNASDTLATLGTTWFSGLNNAILSTNSNGQVVATSSIGTNYLTGTLAIANGGTGTSTAPSYGEVLVGNANGGYDLLATSSLGIVGGGGGSSNVSTSSQNTWSALQIFAGNASSSNFSNFGTAYFGGTATSSFNSAGALTLAGITNALLSANGSGQVVATTSIGTNLLTGSLGTINGTTLNAGGSVTVSAASSTLLADNNSFSGSNTFTKLLSLSGGASTTQLSVVSEAYFGGTATTTIKSNGDVAVGGVLSLGMVTSCSGGQALQTDGSGNISCGTIATGGASSGGGWTTNNTGRVSLSTTTDLAVVGASTTPYAKFTVLSGANATTTFALVPAASQTANIIDIYAPGGGVNSVFTASDWLGIGTTSPAAALSVGGSGYLTGGLGVGVLNTSAGTLQTSGNATVGGALTVNGTATSTFSGNMLVSGNIVPSADNTYTLGLASTTWKSVYIGPGSLFVNGEEVVHTDVGQNVIVSASTNENLELYGTGSTNIILNPSGTGDIQLEGPVQITGGKAVTTSDGTAVPFTDGLSAGNLELTGNVLQASNLNGGISLTPNGNGGTYFTNGNVGIGTTNPGSKLEVEGTVAAQTFNATSTSATSTFANGINLTGGCVEVGGTCIGSGAVTSVSNSDGTLTISPTSGAVVASLALGHANSWTGLQQFANASTTLFSAYGPAYFGATATSSFNSAGQLTLANLTSALLKTDSAGKVVAATAGTDYQSPITASYPILFSGNNLSLAFGTTTANSWSQLQQFNGGLTAYASSTIGNGTQAGGLTINGTATTTGFLVFNAPANPGDKIALLPNQNSLFVASTTGHNYGFGQGALINSTGGQSGQRNIAIGDFAMNGNGSDNVAIGDDTSQNENGHSRTVVIGSGAGGSDAPGNDSVAIGYQAGYDAAWGPLGGAGNIAIGSLALGGDGPGAYNTAVGYQSGYNVGDFAGNGAYNTLFGYSSGWNIFKGYGNIAIGASSSPNITNGSNTISIGNSTYFASSTENNQLNIGNILFGSLPATTTGWTLPTSGTIGIGTTSPASKFGIALNNGDTLATAFQISSSTASATTTLFSVSNTGVITSSKYTNGALAADASGNLYTFATSTWTFASSTILTDNNTFSGSNTFSSLLNLSGGASTTQLSVYNNAWFGATATSSFNSQGQLNLADQGQSTSTLITLGGVPFLSASTSAASFSGKNVFLGLQSGESITSGYNNNGFGYQSLEKDTTGSDNTAIGYQDLSNNTTGNENTAIGFWDLSSNTTGFNNVASGYETLYHNTTGDYNVGNGNSALYLNTTGAYNTAMGTYALENNSTASYNTALGYATLFYNSTGQQSTAVGDNALYTNSTGNYNSAFGDSALDYNSNGSNDTAVGYSALFYNSDATSSTAVGYYAGAGSVSYHNQGGTYFGYEAGYKASNNSDYNTFLGYRAGYSDLTGANNIAIGANVDVPGTTTSQQLNIGDILYGSNIYNGSTVSSAPVLNGSIGIGTTTPWAKLSIAANNGDTNTTLFAIASSTASATTTLFSVSNTGVITSSKYTNGALAADASGNLYTFATSTWTFASSTILTDNNTFSGNNIFSNTLTLTSGFVAQASSTVVGGFTSTGLGTFGNGLSVSGATSTFAGGITISSGCVFYNGSCIGANSGTVNSGTTGQFPYYASNGTTLTATSSLFLTTAGNVGIGTTTPGDLSGASRYLTLAAPGSGEQTSALELAGNSNTVNGTLGRISFLNQTGWTEDARISTAIGSDTSYGNLIFSTGNFGSLSEAMRIDQNQNVGIGTTSPATLLSVGGNGYLTGGLGVGVLNTTAGTLQTSGKGTIGGVLAVNGTTGTTTIASGQGFTIGGSQLVLQQGSGNVGVGTSTPTYALDVVSTNNNDVARFSSTNSGVGSIIDLDATQGGGGHDFRLVSSGPSNSCLGGDKFSIGDTAVPGLCNGYRLVLDSSGNLGIGTTSPFTKLGVAGDAYIGGNLTATGTVAFTGLGSGIVGSSNGQLYTFASSSLTAASSTLLSDNNTFSGNNIFSSLLNLTNGLLATASSTIGNGTQTGGLTINGGATTTGTSYFAGQVGIGTSTPDALFSIYNGISGVGSRQYALDVEGGSNTSSANGDGSILLVSASGAGSAGISAGNITLTAGNGGQNAPFGTGGAGGSVYISAGAGGTGGSAKGANGNILLGINAAGVAVGNVGIGTTSPWKMLSVAGDIIGTNITATGTLSVTGTGTSTFSNGLQAADFSLTGTATSTAANGINLASGCFSINGTCVGAGSGSSASSTLLSDNNTFSGNNTFTKLLNLADQGQSTSTILTLGGIQFLAASTSASVGNTFLGLQAGQGITSGSRNTGVGYQALSADTSGLANTAIGNQALLNNITGNYNTANGFYALTANTTGGSNTASGHSALYSNTTGSNNTANGNDALFFTTTGSDNIGSGYWALFHNTTGSYNAAFGYQVGQTNTVGTSTTLIGAFADASANNLSTSTAIGAGSIVGCSSCLVLGGTGQNAVDVGIGTSTPWAKLAISANNGETNTSLFLIASSTASATTTLFSVSNTGAITTALSSGFVGSSGGSLYSIASSSLTAASSTLLSDNNTFSGSNTFTKLLSLTGGASTTQLSVFNNAYFGATATSSFTSQGILDLADNGNVTSTILELNGASLLSASSSSSIGNLFLGLSTGTSTGKWNTGVGYDVLSANSSGFGNTALGYQSLQLNTTGGGQTAIGAQALENVTTGSNNSAFGYNALLNVTNGYDNTALGSVAGDSLTSGIQDTYIGREAGYRDLTGTNNVGIGWQAYLNATSSSDNTALGASALQGSTVGNQTISGNYNVAVGNSALQNFITASQNTAVGYDAMLNATSTNSNAAFGYQALEGNSSDFSGTDNSAFGYQVLQSNSTGSWNVAVGTDALPNNTTGSRNLALGVGALLANTTGWNNFALGNNTLNSITGSNNNFAVGYNAGASLTSGDNNILLFGGGNLVTGSNNIAIGNGGGSGIDFASTSSSNQLDVQNIIFGTNNAGAGSTPSTGQVGIGTTTPWARLAIQANNGDTNTSLFAIASSTASATTTLFSINNTGVLALNPAAQTGDLVATFGGSNFLEATSSSVGTLALGYQAGQSLLATSTAAGNTVFGYQALNAATSSIYNTAIGYQALASVDDYAAQSNTAVGYRSLVNDTTGQTNTALGYETLFGNTTGSNNSAYGYLALDKNSSGGSNMGFGSAALFGNTTGSDNIAIGTEAANGNYSNYAADDNVAIGTQAGFYFQNGASDNTLIGYRAGRDITTGANNIIFGSRVDAPVVSGNQQLNIGNILYGTNLYNGGSMSSVPVLDGNIGIGTSTPWAKLAISANNGDTNKNLFLISSSTASATTTLFSISNTGYLTAGGGNFTVDSSGSASAADLYVDAFSQYSGLYVQSSGVNVATLFGSAGGNDNGQLGLYNGGTQKVNIVASGNSYLNGGNLGIGTTTPWATLAISANNGGTNTTLFAIASSTASATTTLFSISNTGALTQAGGATSTFSNGFNITAGCFSVNGTCVGGGGSGSGTVSSGTQGQFAFYNTAGTTVSGTSTIFISTAGNIGIGTTTPWAQLSVTSPNQQNGSTALFSVASTTGSRLFDVLGNGNVGIGTTSPTSSNGSVGNLAEIASAKNSVLVLSSSGGAPYSGILEGRATSDVTSGDARMGQIAFTRLTDITPGQVSGAIKFFTTNDGTISQKMVIDNSGDVGIGTSSPQAKLEVSDSSAATTTPLILSNYGAATSSTDVGLLFKTGDISDANGTTTASITSILQQNYASGQGDLAFSVLDSGALKEAMRVANTGNVGVGTTSPSTTFAVSQTTANPQFTLAYDASHNFQLRVDSAGGLNAHTSSDQNYFVNDNLWVCTGGTITSNACPSGNPTGQGNLVVANRLGIGTSTLGVANANSLLDIWTSDGTGGTSFVSISTSTSAGANFKQIFKIDGNGNVMIGTSSAPEELSVGGLLYVGANSNSAVTMGTATSTFNGDVKILGKLDVATIDPVYTIDGTKYATYGESSTGVREETMQNIELTHKDPTTGKYVYTVDFDTLAKGSDLWLFYQATDFGASWENLVVELTPSFDGTAFYKKIPGKHELLVEADQPGEVAMRLSADRFDSSKWGNVRPDQNDTSYPGFILSSKPAAGTAAAAVSQSAQ